MHSPVGWILEWGLKRRVTGSTVGTEDKWVDGVPCRGSQSWLRTSLSPRSDRVSVKVWGVCAREDGQGQIYASKLTLAAGWRWTCTEAKSRQVAVGVLRVSCCCMGSGEGPREVGRGWQWREVGGFKRYLGGTNGRTHPDSPVGMLGVLEYGGPPPG